MLVKILTNERKGKKYNQHKLFPCQENMINENAAGFKTENFIIALNVCILLSYICYEKNYILV
jgi:hypothetical protein